jgi:hypothetical protein
VGHERDGDDDLQQAVELALRAHVISRVEVEE